MTGNCETNQLDHFRSVCGVQIDLAQEDGRMCLVCRKVWFWIIDADGMIGTRK
jgi:hypothetical protein